MTLLKRFIPLVLAVLLSACINLPEVGEPTPDPGVSDGGTPPDGGAPADMIPPTITAAAPAHGSTNVTASPQFQFTFSEPMNVGTVQVTITPTVALSSAVWTSNNTQLTLQPQAPLAQNTPYTLSVEGKDVAGNALTNRKQYSFETTGPAPDTTAPTILAISPSYGTIGVAQNATLTVTFSEPMDKASAQTAFAIAAPSGFNAGVFTWNTEGTVMTFNPDTDFPYGATVEWQVTTIAKDLAGNTLASPTAASFRAVRVNTVTISYDPPTTGSAGSPGYWKQTHYFFGSIVGDTGSSSIQQRLLLGFKLDLLPETLTRITSSKLTWYTSHQLGTPFSDLGRLFLESVYIGEEIALSSAEWTNPVAKTQYESPTLGPPLVISADSLTPNGIFDVASFVVRDWEARTTRGTKRSQFRLRFETPNDGDSLNDAITADGDSVPAPSELKITYEYP